MSTGGRGTPGQKDVKESTLYSGGEVSGKVGGAGRNGTMRGAIANQQMMVEVEKKLSYTVDRLQTLEIQ